MLKHVKAELEDPILKVMASFKASPAKNKHDLGIGVYRDSSGATPIFKAVKEAELILQKNEKSKAYLGPIGDVEFNRLLRQMLFSGTPLLDSDSIQSIQTPGGTGALRIAGELLNRAVPGAKLWLSDPAWSTHKPIFTSAGLTTATYRYFDAHSKQLDFTGLCDDLNSIPESDVVLLQSCGNNPSGCNLTKEQWYQVSQLMAERKLLPLLDLAYHGWDQGLDGDLVSLSAIESYHDEWMLCYSASKTFSLYNDRTGALIVRSVDADASRQVLNLTLNLVCANYYMPPAHGASVVRTILSSAELTDMWQQELNAARSRVEECRQRFIQALQTKGSEAYDFLKGQRGLFVYLGLDEKQLDWLRQEHALYFGPGGRLNIAGLNRQNLPLICDALLDLEQLDPCSLK